MRGDVSQTLTRKYVSTIGSMSVNHYEEYTSISNTRSDVGYGYGYGRAYFTYIYYDLFTEFQIRIYACYLRVLTSSCTILLWQCTWHHVSLSFSFSHQCMYVHMHTHKTHEKKEFSIGMRVCMYVCYLMTSILLWQCKWYHVSLSFNLLNQQQKSQMIGTY